MKKIKLLLPLFIIGILSSCEVDTPEKARVYYDSIIKKTNLLITGYEVELMNSFKDFIPEEMEEKYNELADFVEKTDKEINEIEPYFGDATMIDDAKALLKAYKEALPLYKEKVELESVESVNYTDEIAKKSKKLSKEIDDILNDANEKFQKSSKEFAKVHNFPIKNS